MPADSIPDTTPSITDLFEAYESGMQRYAANLTRDDDQARDLVSETFLRALTHLPLLGKLTTYQKKAWLYRVLKNRFIDLCRAEKRKRLLVEQITWNISQITPAVIAQDVFSQAPERYKELIHMSYVLGMTSEEIGLKLGVPAATVRSRQRLAIKWLRDHLSK